MSKLAECDRVLREGWEDHRWPSANLRGYKLCPGCGQPMLKKGQKRKHPDDYRHAKGCPNDK